jgi:signal transduction histidine kinase
MGFQGGIVVVSVALLLTSAAWSTIGTLIAGQMPQNPIGWLLSAAAAIAAVTIFALGLAAPAEGPVGAEETLAGWWLVLVPLSTIPPLLIVAFLYFPGGRLAGKWARAGVAAAIFGGMAVALGYLARPDKLGLSDLGLAGPGWARDIPSHQGLPGAGGLLLAASFLMAAVSVGIQYRRASATDRKALRWVIRLLLVLPVLPLLLFLGWPGFALAFLVGGVIVLFALPAALLVAVLRSQVFEVELQIKRTLVLGAVVLFVVVSFIVAVGFVTTMFTGTIEPVVAIPAVLIAVAIGPVRRGAQRAADRLLYGERATPYEVLSNFSERVGETYSTEDVLPRMVQLLAAGTGATEARVWIRSGGVLRSAAVFPVDAPNAVPIPAGEELPALPDVTVAFPVEHGGKLLGALTLKTSKMDPMNASKERLARDLASQAGLVLRNVALIEDLRESRRRIVATQDERARKLERDIHDGAQQQLVALSVKLRLAEQLVDRDPDAAKRLLGELQGEATDAVDTLRDLARGIYPPLLADKGLVVALDAQARKAPLPVDVDAEGLGRFTAEVEAAVYFVCLEALQNVSKYARASTASIALMNGDGVLRFEVSDDGQGFDPSAVTGGTGIQNMEDRLAALKGSLTIDSHPGAGTRVTGLVPLGIP